MESFLERISLKKIGHTNKINRECIFFKCDRKEKTNFLGYFECSLFHLFLGSRHLKSRNLWQNWTNMSPIAKEECHFQAFAFFRTFTTKERKHVFTLGHFLYRVVIYLIYQPITAQDVFPICFWDIALDMLLSSTDS